MFEKVFTEKIYDEYYKKYREKHYQGKLTKKESILWRKIDIAESILWRKIDIAESYPPGTYEKLLCN